MVDVQAVVAYWRKHKDRLDRKARGEEEPQDEVARAAERAAAAEAAAAERAAALERERERKKLEEEEDDDEEEEDEEEIAHEVLACRDGGMRFPPPCRAPESVYAVPRACSDRV